MTQREEKIREQLQSCSIDQLKEISRVAKLMAEEKQGDMEILTAPSMK